MRIAVVVESFPSVSETFITNQIIEFIKNGHEILIFSYHKGETGILHENVIHYRLLERVQYLNNFTEEKYSSSLKFLLLLIRNSRKLNYSFLKELIFKVLKTKTGRLLLVERLQWFILNSKIDIVHVHFGPIANRILEIKKFKSLVKLKIFTSFHGYDLRPDQIMMNKKRYKKLFKLGDGFIVNTKYLESILKKVKGDLRRVQVIPVGLDTSVFQSKRKQRIHNTLLFCGRLVELKGPHLAIKITHLIKSKSFPINLTILGAGELEKDLRVLVDKLNLKNEVIFLGAKTQFDVVEQMSRNQLFILPGIRDLGTNEAETQGLVIQEAQAMRMPVLVSNVGGMKYGLIEGETGFVLPENDLEAFSEVIIKLLSNPEKIEEMGKSGRDFVEKEYAISKIAKKHLVFFQDALLSHKN
tara:strand:- start:10454 stop:11692 length:1239 start_codon:yes stop_codon:yes gene_type:complete